MIKINNKISVIIVNWNTKDLLIDCVQSIRDSSSSDQIEIVVIDNASIDGSAEALRSKFSDLVIIENNKNEGFSKANNQGIKISTGYYVCFVNSDVVVQGDTINKMKDYLENNPNIGLLGPKMLYPDGTFQISYRKAPSIWGAFCDSILLNKLFSHLRLFNPLYDYAKISESITPVEVLVGAFWMIRRSVIDQIGDLDENFFFYAEDIDYCKRVWSSNLSVVYFPNAQIYHRHGASSSSKPNVYYIEQKRANLFYWRKHYGILSKYCIVFIMITHEFVRLWLCIVSFVFPSRNHGVLRKMKKHLDCLFWLLLSQLLTINIRR
jgi:GT2 family glycosyltransferase